MDENLQLLLLLNERYVERINLAREKIFPALRYLGFEEQSSKAVLELAELTRMCNIQILSLKLYSISGGLISFSEFDCEIKRDGALRAPHTFLINIIIRLLMKLHRAGFNVLFHRFTYIAPSGEKHSLCATGFNIRKSGYNVSETDAPSKTRAPHLPTYLPGSRSTRLSVAG